MTVSQDLTDAAADLAAWGQAEGVAMFVVHSTDAGHIRYIGPQLPAKLVAQMFRAAADGYEAQVHEHTLN